MKNKLICLSFLFIEISCNSQNSTNKIMKDNNPVSSERKGISNTIIDPNKYVHIEMGVQEISADSIMVDATFLNDSNDSFLLYKPLLPNDNPQLSTFIVLTQMDHEEVDFMRPPDSSLKYYSGTYNALPVLIPELKSDNFIKLGKHENVSFSMNIAKFYDFKDKIRRGKTKFSISYLNLFPEILDLKPITKRDPIDNGIKPVYTVITLKGGKGGVAKIDFTLKLKQFEEILQIDYGSLTLWTLFP